MFIFLVPLLLWVVNKLVVYRLKPKMNKRQITLLRNFVDKLERVAEHAQTPVFIIVFRVARDVLFPREPNYIQSVTSESTTLKPDFIALQKSFEK